MTCMIVIDMIHQSTQRTGSASAYTAFKQPKTCLSGGFRFEIHVSNIYGYYSVIPSKSCSTKDGYGSSFCQQTQKIKCKKHIQNHLKNQKLPLGIIQDFVHDWKSSYFDSIRTLFIPKLAFGNI